jgi:hypothetical protein
MTRAGGPVTEQIAIRRTLRDGDAQAIAELHRRIYEPEYGLNEQFTASVEEGVEAAATAGWPQCSGALWLVERDGPLLGALASPSVAIAHDRAYTRRVRQRAGGGWGAAPRPDRQAGASIETMEARKVDRGTPATGCLTLSFQRDDPRLSRRANEAELA